MPDCSGVFDYENTGATSDPAPDTPANSGYQWSVLPTYHDIPP